MKETSLIIKIIVCVFAAVLMVGLLVALTKGANDNTGSWFDEIVEFFSGDSSDSGGGGGSADKDESATETVERSEGDPLCSHVYDKGTVELAATCSKEGRIVYACKECSKTYEDVIEATGEHLYGSPKKYNNIQHVVNCTTCDNENKFIDHVFTESVIQPTCTVNGVKINSCVCGFQTTVTLTKTGHNVLNWFKVDNDSFYHYGICSNGCGDKVSESHDYVDGTIIPATCTNSGSKTSVCSICGYTKVVNIPATGHNLVEDTSWDGAKASTCTTYGYKLISCTVVGCDYEEIVTIPFSGHTFTGDYRSNGDNTHSMYCDKCNSAFETSTCVLSSTNYYYLNEVYHKGVCRVCNGDILHTHMKIPNVNQEMYCPACNHVFG